jgi:hypothetical protein
VKEGERGERVGRGERVEEREEWKSGRVEERQRKERQHGLKIWSVGMNQNNLNTQHPNTQLLNTQHPNTQHNTPTLSPPGSPTYWGGSQIQRPPESVR